MLGLDPFMSKEKAKELGIEWYEKVDDMLRASITSRSTRRSPKKRAGNLIDIPQLERLKPGVRLINAARGGIYNKAGARRRAEIG